MTNPPIDPYTAQETQLYVIFILVELIQTVPKLWCSRNAEALGTEASGKECWVLAYMRNKFITMAMHVH